jgi:deazaflavin-dependent oxidoreductase (nitroreductase family)
MRSLRSSATANYSQVAPAPPNETVCTSLFVRHVVVEAVDHDRATDTHCIASGFGEKSDWFQNTQKNPETAVHVGRRHFATLAKHLSADEGEKHLAICAQEHPFAFSELSGLMLGERLDPTPNNARHLADKIPMVALGPKAIS